MVNYIFRPTVGLNAPHDPEVLGSEMIALCNKTNIIDNFITYYSQPR